MYNHLKLVALISFPVLFIKGLSEVSCENCTHTAKKKRLYKGCYTQRDSGGVWTTPEMSGQGLHYGRHYGYWDTEGMYED